MRELLYLQWVLEELCGVTKCMNESIGNMVGDDGDRKCEHIEPET